MKYISVTDGRNKEAIARRASSRKKKKEGAEKRQVQGSKTRGKEEKGSICS